MLSQERIAEKEAHRFEVSQEGMLLNYEGPGGHVVIPAGVTTIADRAFSGCVALKHVVIPAGVTEIGLDAFLGVLHYENL